MNLALAKNETVPALSDLFAVARTRLPGAGKVADLRQKAFEAYERIGLPHRRIEDWKYTDLRALMRDAKPLASPPAVRALQPQALGDALPDIAAHNVAIVNGAFAPGWTDVNAADPGVTVTELFAWLANTGHWPDVGGMVPGGFSASATEVEQEGLRLPPVKFWKKGVMDQEILSIILSNIRIADQRIGDIKAQAAALTTGEVRLTALIDRYGAEMVRQAIAEMRHRAVDPESD